MSYVLARATQLDLASFAQATGTHPDLVRRLVITGALDARIGPDGELWFSPAQVATMGRIQRLRASFMLSYPALGLVIDLLDRIAVLQAALAARPRAGYQDG